MFNYYYQMMLTEMERIISRIGYSLANKKIAVLEAGVRKDNAERWRQINEYLDKHSDDIEGAKEKFGISKIEENCNDWYQHEML